MERFPYLAIVTLALIHLSTGEFQPYQEAALRVHNELRANHGDAGDLILKPDLTEMAVKCAQYYLEKGKLDRTCPHKTYPKKGDANENFFWHKNGNLDGSLVAEAAARKWYTGIRDWDFEKNKLKDGAPKNHEFPQMVCRGTGWIGFGIASSPAKGTFAVALYLGIFKWIWNAKVMKKNIIIPTKDMVDPRTEDEILGLPVFKPSPIQEAVKYEHNFLRARHSGTPEVILNEELCDLAKKCAEWYMAEKKLDGNCPHKNTPKGLLGENLFWHFSVTTEERVLAESAVTGWYLGAQKWDFKAGQPLNGSTNPKQFTQLLCKTCNVIGVGLAQSLEMGTFLVVLYQERVSGYWKPEKMKQNVLPTEWSIDEHYLHDTRIPFDTEDYQSRALDLHNHQKVLHASTREAEMVLDMELCILAKKCAEWYLTAEKIEGNCPYKNTAIRGLAGENVLWQFSGLLDPGRVVATAVRDWYLEAQAWDFAAGRPLPGFKNPKSFTQMVCKTSTKVGFGVAQNPENGTVFVALYLERVKGFWSAEKMKEMILPPEDTEFEQNFESLWWYRQSDSEYALADNISSNLYYALNSAILAHEEVRKFHPGVKNLTADDELRHLADKCAHWYMATGKLDGNCPHKTTRTRGLAGENLFWHHYGENEGCSGCHLYAAVDEWYSGIRKWDFEAAAPKPGLRTPKQFLQLVCKTCTYVGIGFAQNEENGTFVVALYLERFSSHWTKEKLKQVIVPPADLDEAMNLQQNSHYYPPSDYQLSGLEEHNGFRALHPGTPPMVLKDVLNHIAQRCAEWYLENWKKDLGDCPHIRNHPIKGRPAITWACIENTTMELEDVVDSMIKEWYSGVKKWDWSAAKELEGESRPLSFIRVVHKYTQWLGIGAAVPYYGDENPRVSCVVATYLENPDTLSRPVLLPTADQKVDNVIDIPIEPYQQRALDVHNELRNMHPGTPKMALKTELNLMASQCAQWYANQTDGIQGKCPMKTHPVKGTAGANLYYHAGSNSIDGAGLVEVAIREWYAHGIHSWDFAKGTPKEKHGHPEEFTQMMNGLAVDLGVGVVQTQNRGTIIVMLYWERRHGWKPDRYIKNLLPPADPGVLPKPMFVTPPNDFQKWAAGMHIELRLSHPNTPEMIMLESYNSVAQRCAEYYLERNKLDRKCPYKKKWNPVHGGDSGGENFYWFAPGQAPDLVEAVKKTVQLWYREGGRWDFEKADVKTTENHGKMAFPVMFAQMIICKNSLIGIGVAQDLDKGTFVVAFYENDVEKKTSGSFRKGTFWKENLMPSRYQISLSTEGVTTMEEGPKDDWILKHYQVVGLQVHNDLRARHVDTPPMELNKELNQMAERCADYYAKTGKFDHSCPYKQGVGENLFQASGIMITDDQCAEMSVKGWYDEIKFHNFSNPKFLYKTGHYTQVVWTTSTLLGMGVAKWKDNVVVGVALYRKPGNVGGMYSTCTKPLKNEYLTTAPTTTTESAVTFETTEEPPDDADGADAIKVVEPPEETTVAELEITTQEPDSVEETTIQPNYNDDYPDTTPWPTDI